jgi:peroxiredoxin
MRDAPLAQRRRPASVLLLVAVLALAACATVDLPRAAERSEVWPGGPPRDDVLAPGDTIPDFAAPGLQGGRVSWQDRKGAPAVLVVWAAWCPHCRRLVPVLARVAREFPTVRLLSVTTSIGRRPGPSPAEFLEQFGLSFPVALDDGDNRLAHALGVYRYPVVYWTGRDGRIRRVTLGESTEAALRQAFRIALAEPL